MAESAPGTTLRDWRDQPFEDNKGNMWRISPSEQVMVDNHVQRGTSGVRELSYSGNGRVWKWGTVLGVEKLWQFSDDPGDRWQPHEGTNIPPYGPPPDQRIEQISQGIVDLKAAVSTDTLEGRSQTTLIAKFVGMFGQFVLQNEVDKGEIFDALNHILAKLDVVSVPVDNQAVSARLVVPQFRLLTGEKVTMATNILADVISVIPVVFDNVGGAPVLTPSGGTATATIDNTSAFSVSTETEDNGSLVVLVTPTQPPQIGQAGTISFSDVVNGLTITAPSVDVVITEDTTANNAHLDTSNITTRPLPAAPAQPAPAA